MYCKPVPATTSAPHRATAAPSGAQRRRRVTSPPPRVPPTHRIAWRPLEFARAVGRSIEYVQKLIADKVIPTSDVLGEPMIPGAFALAVFYGRPYVPPADQDTPLGAPQEAAA
jgi:hypothetical protein